MKKLFIVFLLISSLILIGAVSGQEDKVQEYTSIEELAVAFSSYFPKAQGEVTAVQGDRVTLSLGKKGGLIPGMVLTLWRDGREILHPITSAVIGRAEDEVGTVEVAGVNDTSATAVVKKKLKDAKQGDKARITPKKINVALVPLNTDHSEVVRTLSELLNEFGRFNVLESGKVNAFLKNSSASDSGAVKELGRAFGLDAVITLGIYPSGNKLMTTARIFYAEDAGQLDTVVAMLNLKPGDQAFGEIKPFFTPADEENITTPELPFLAQAFTTGDFEGDGKVEYVFSDGTRLHIYRNEPSGWREVWTETDNAPAPRLEWQEQVVVAQASAIQHINLDTADINADGKQEIFVTTMLNEKVFSYIVEFRGESYRKTADIPGFLRVASYPGKGVILIGQAYDPSTFYAGKPKQYVWSDGTYVPGADIQLPQGLGIYGWTFADFGERAPLLIAIDDRDHLTVYSGETPVWKSVEQYAAMDRFVNKPATGIQAVLSKQADPSDKGRRVRLRGRVLAVDVNGDGKDEIVLPKNVQGGFLGGLSSAEFNILAWTNSRLDSICSIKDVPGPVSDFRFTSKSRSKVFISALVRTKGGIFAKDRQQVLTYSIH